MAEYLSPGVFVEELSSGIKPIEAVGSSTAAVVGHAERGPVGVATQITNFGQFVRIFGNPIDDGYLAFAVKTFFDEGGSTCYVVRTSHYTGSQPDAVASALPLAAIGNAAVTALTVRASSPGGWGDTLTVTIAHTGVDEFTIAVFQSGAAIQTLTALSMDPLRASYAPQRVALESTVIRVTDGIPAGSVLTMAGRRPVAVATPAALTGGDDGLGVALATADYIGSSTIGNGLHALDSLEDVNIVLIPDAVERQVHVEGMAYCESRQDCVYVADAPELARTATEVLNFKFGQGLYSGGSALNSKYGALYTPWIDVLDPRTGATIRIPPSGAVAGRYARTDQVRGVHKAPAGVSDGRMASVVRLAAEFGVAEQERLNPEGINVIRRFAGVGHVIWGARTVSTDPEWRYLNVRRLFLVIEKSIELGTGWTVFEPNDPTLWKSIVRNVSGFLRLQWRAGALVGSTEEEAFFVKCDAETNPPESVEAGRVVTEIGVAPSKPAEFVIFRVGQFQGGAEITE